MTLLVGGNITDMLADMSSCHSCCLVFEDSQQVTDIMTGSQSQSHVSIFRDTTFAKLVQSQHVRTDVVQCHLGQVTTFLMLPTCLMTHPCHVSMSVADMSDVGSSRHDMMPTIPAKHFADKQFERNFWIIQLLSPSGSLGSPTPSGRWVRSMI